MCVVRWLYFHWLNKHINHQWQFIASIEQHKRQWWWYAVSLHTRLLTFWRTAVPVQHDSRIRTGGIRSQNAWILGNTVSTSKMLQQTMSWIVTTSVSSELPLTHYHNQFNGLNKSNHLLVHGKSRQSGKKKLPPKLINILACPLHWQIKISAKLPLQLFCLYICLYACTLRRPSKFSWQLILENTIKNCLGRF